MQEGGKFRFFLLVCQPFVIIFLRNHLVFYKVLSIPHVGVSTLMFCTRVQNMEGLLILVFGQVETWYFRSFVGLDLFFIDGDNRLTDQLFLANGLVEKSTALYLSTFILLSVMLK